MKGDTTQMLEAWRNSGKPDYMVDRNGLYLKAIEGDVEHRLTLHDATYTWQYEAAIRDGLLPTAISARKFWEVGAELIKAAYAAPPSGLPIRAISTGE